MPACQLCQKFFRNALASVHCYRRNALLDAAAALSGDAPLTLTGIGRSLPGRARVKAKIKRVDRLLGNERLHRELPLIAKNIAAMLTEHLSWCVIAVDWSGYAWSAFHVLRASLVFDGRAIPLMSRVVPEEQLNSLQVQADFLDALHAAIGPGRRVVVLTDAGFKSAWFRHVSALGWDFIGRVRGNNRFRLDGDGQAWQEAGSCAGVTGKPAGLGSGELFRTRTARCAGYFYGYKKPSARRKARRARGRPHYAAANREHSASAKEPWVLFCSTDRYSAKTVIRLYSRRMQIEQNFRDEKSERYGFGLRASQSRSAARMAVPGLIAQLAGIMLWFAGYDFESRGLHRDYQANSVRHCRVLSFLTLAKNVLRNAPPAFTRVRPAEVLRRFASTYRETVLACCM